MRLLASDFDGTLFRKGTISPADRQMLAHWREQGNLFGIVTGRGARTLLADLSRFDLAYDFLLCNNGALLLGANARFLAGRPLAPELSRRLLTHGILEHCTSCALFSGLDMYVLEGCRPWLNPVYSPSVLARQRALAMDFLQISFGFEQRADSWGWGERLQKELTGKARVQCSLSVADVTAPDVDKASGIAWAMEVLGHKPDETIAAGDDGNDMDMLARYRGYALAAAGSEILGAACGRHAASIADLIGQLL